MGAPQFKLSLSLLKSPQGPTAHAFCCRLLCLVITIKWYVLVVFFSWPRPLLSVCEGVLAKHCRLPVVNACVNLDSQQPRGFYDLCLVLSLDEALR